MVMCYFLFVILILHSLDDLLHYRELGWGEWLWSLSLHFFHYAVGDGSLRGGQYDRPRPRACICRLLLLTQAKKIKSRHENINVKNESDHHDDTQYAKRQGLIIVHRIHTPVL